MFRTRRLLSLLAALGAAASLAVTSAVAAPATATSTSASSGHASLVDSGNFPDPGFLHVDSVYVAYSTGTGFPSIGSNSPQSGYAGSVKSMASIPAWVDSSNPLLWAPDVFVSNDSGGRLYVMYFTGESSDYGVHCIGVATSRSARSGFVAQSRPIVCSPNRTSGYEAIDPSMFLAADGSRYMLYKSDYQNASGFDIRAIQMDSATGTALAGNSFSLISTGTSKIEAPSAIVHDGKVWLFSSRGDYVDCSYSTDVWSAASITSTFTRQKTVLSTSSTGLCGPGGATVINDGSTTRIAFHAYPDADHNGVKDSSTRQAWVGSLTWGSDGEPSLY